MPASVQRKSRQRTTLTVLPCAEPVKFRSNCATSDNGGLNRQSFGIDLGGNTAQSGYITCLFSEFIMKIVICENSFFA